MSPSKTAARTLIAGALATAAFLLWPSTPKLYPPLDTVVYSEPRLDYGRLGEHLFHRVYSPGVSYHMPMSSLSASLLYCHNRFSAKVSQLSYRLALSALALALSCLLGPPSGFAITLAFWVTLSSMIGHFLPYPAAPFSLLVLLVAGLLVWRAQSPSTAKTLLLALSIGATYLFRSPLAFFPPVLCLFEWAQVHRGSLRRCWKQMLILCVVPYLFLLPWMRMNWILHREFIPLENGQANTNVTAGALGLIATSEGDWESLLADDLGGDPDGGAVVLWAVREIFRHPLRYLSAYLSRLGSLFQWHPVLLLMGLTVFWLRRKGRDVASVGLLLLYYVAIHCCMPVYWPFVLAIWPLSAVLAASWIARRWRPEPLLEPTGRRWATLVLTGLLALVLALCGYTQWTVWAYSDVAARGPSHRDEALARAVRLNPTDDWPLSERGLDRLRRGDIPGAIEDLSAALAIQEDNPEIQLELARARMLQGDFGPMLALPILSYRVDHIQRMNLLIHCYKADIYLRTRRERDFRAELSAALKSSGLDIFVFPVDRKRASRILEERPSPDRFLNAMGRCLEGRPLRETLAFVRAATEMAPERAGLWILMADVRRQLGQQRQARESLARAQTLRLSARERRRIADMSRRLGPAL